MKHIKSYQIFENQEPQHLEHPGFPRTEEEIHRLCEKYKITNYTINKDLSIDVNGDVGLWNRLRFIPLKFNYVSGVFTVSFNKLKTLEGSPKEVGGDFNCVENNLTSLKGCPSKVGKSFSCGNNILTSLEYCPSEVGGNFDCTNSYLETLEGCSEIIGGNFKCTGNKLETLEGCPEIIDGDFNCTDNRLETLEGSPKKINGDFNCILNARIRTLNHIPNAHNYSLNYTSINNLVYTFIKKDNVNELISEFNHYRITDGKVVYKDRLEMFCSDFDLDIPDLDEVKKYYKIV